MQIFEVLSFSLLYPVGLLTGMGALASVYHIMKAKEWAD